MRVLGLTIERTKAAAGIAPPSSLMPLASRSGGGWWPIVREPSTGAWQRNEEIRAETALAYPAVFACVTLIAADIGAVQSRPCRRAPRGPDRPTAGLLRSSASRTVSNPVQVFSNNGS
jgi:hypothetical protein